MSIYLTEWENKKPSKTLRPGRAGLARFIANIDYIVEKKKKSVNNTEKKVNSFRDNALFWFLVWRWKEALDCEHTCNKLMSDFKPVVCKISFEVLFENALSNINLYRVAQASRYKNVLCLLHIILNQYWFLFYI